MMRSTLTIHQKRRLSLGLMLTLAGSFLPWKLEGDPFARWVCGIEISWKYGAQVYPALEDHGGGLVVGLSLLLFLLITYPGLISTPRRERVVCSAALVLVPSFHLLYIFSVHSAAHSSGAPVSAVGLWMVLAGALLLWFTSVAAPTGAATPIGSNPAARRSREKRAGEALPDRLRLWVDVIDDSYGDHGYPAVSGEHQPRIWDLRDPQTLKLLLLAYGNGIILELRAEGENQAAIDTLRGIATGTGSSSPIELDADARQRLWLYQEGDECYRQPFPGSQGGYTFINPLPQPHKFEQ